jgi:hypothetical protein
MIESRAGEEPPKESSKPPSWLIESIVPENMLITFIIGRL